MTDWGRVERLRRKGASWEAIAADPRVGFTPDPGAEPGRSLKVLYNHRKSKLGTTRAAPRADPASPGRGGARSARSFSRGSWIALAVVAILVAAAVGYLLVREQTGTASSPAAPAVVTYCGGEGSAAHYHVLLVINVNGVQQHLPYDPSQAADIGFLDQPGFTNGQYYCPSGGIHALHTHDGSGIIHAELPPEVVSSGHTPTLGDFFTIWGEPLSPGSVWSYSGTVTATMYDSDTHTSKDYSADPAGMPLYYPPGGPLSNPYTIPSNLIFNAQYGNGQSGGTFGGEIIWLNVTSTSAAGGPAATANVLMAGSAHATVGTIAPFGDGLSAAPPPGLRAITGDRWLSGVAGWTTGV